MHILNQLIMIEMESTTLSGEIEHHAAKRKLLLHATQMAHKHGHAFRKLVPSSSTTRSIIADHLSELSSAEKRVHRGWTRRKNILEHLQVYLLFQNSCRTALSQIQSVMQKEKSVARSHLERITERLGELNRLAEMNQANSHASKMQNWVEKIRQKHIDLHRYCGESVDHLPYNMDSLAIRKRQIGASSNSSSNHADRRKSHLQAELLKTERDYISTLKLALSVYLPAARRKTAPPAVRRATENRAIFGNMAELLEFHERFNEQLSATCELEELAHCFVINSEKLSELYVEYCKGKERSAAIIEAESDGYFVKIQQEEKVDQPIQSCLIWPIQRITKYSLLLRELLECAKSTSNDKEGAINAETKIKEALTVMEDVPRKANDAMHLALLQEPPIGQDKKHNHINLRKRKIKLTFLKNSGN